MSILTVTVPAPNRSLTTKARAREDVKALASAGDTWLDRAIERASDDIAKYLKIPRGDITPPTLAQETLTEVFRIQRGIALSGFWPLHEQNYGYCDDPIGWLRLARRPIASITSIDIDGTALTAAEYEMDAAAGLVRRLDTSDNPVYWTGLKLTAVYVAGYVPPGGSGTPALLPRFEEACILAVKDRWLNKDVDPRMRSEEVVGVRTVTRWVGPLAETESGLPAEVERLLDSDVNLRA